MQDKTISITLDTEPDFGGRFGLKWEAVNEQLPILLDLFDQYGIKITLFVEADTLKLPVIKKAQMKGHEIASHGYHHLKLPQTDVIDQMERVKAAFREFGSKPKGFRSPYLATIPDQAEILHKYGFKYDSSLTQAYFPFRYNYLDVPNRIYYPDPKNIRKENLEWKKITEIPPSRIPLSFSTFTVFQSFLRLPGRRWWEKTPNAVYYFHCHDIKQWPKATLKLLPWYMQILYKFHDRHMATLRKVIEQFSDREFKKMEELV